MFGVYNKSVPRLFLQDKLINILISESTQRKIPKWKIYVHDGGPEFRSFFLLLALMINNCSRNTLEKTTVIGFCVFGNICGDRKSRVKFVLVMRRAR